MMGLMMMGSAGSGCLKIMGGMQALNIVALSWRQRVRTVSQDSYLHTRHEELLQARDGWMGGEHRLLKAKGVRLGGGVGRQLGRHDGVELGASQGEARGARDGHAAPCQPWEGCQAAIDGERDLLLRQLHAQLA